MDLTYALAVPYIVNSTTYYLQFQEVGTTGVPSGPYMIQGVYVAGRGPNFNLQDVDSGGRALVSAVFSDPNSSNLGRLVAGPSGGYGPRVHEGRAGEMAECLGRIEELLELILEKLDS